MKNATSSKSYLGLLTGMIIGGIQHYMMTYSKMRAVWGTFTLAERSKKPIAKTIDRRLNHR